MMTGIKVADDERRDPAALAEERFLTLAAALDDAVIVVDAAGVVCFANPAAGRLVEGCAVARPFPLAVSALSSGPCALALPSGLQARFIATLGATSWEGAAATMIVLRRQTSLLSEVGPLVDETLAVMRGRFLSHVSHELRTPLNSIVGFAELLALEPHGPLGLDADAGERYRTYAEDIRWSGARMSALVADLLDLASVNAGELRLAESRFELGPLLAEVLHDAPDAARQGSRPVLGSIEPMIVDGDRDRLKRALVHLVANGLSSGGGDVSLSAKATRDGRLRIGVTDRGPGFAPEALARAGEPFARARGVDRADPAAGLGIGLAVARHMFELHGGGLRIASRAGRGATVTCTLPPGRVVRSGSTGRLSPQTLPP